MKLRSLAEQLTKPTPNISKFPLTDFKADELFDKVELEEIRNKVTWQFLYFKHNILMNYFKELFRMLTIFGVGTMQEPEPKNMLNVIKRASGRLRVPMDVFRVNEYKKELENHNDEIEKLIGANCVTFMLNTVAGIFIPYILVSKEYIAYEKPVTGDMTYEKYETLDLEEEDVLNKEVFRKIFHTYIENPYALTIEYAMPFFISKRIYRNKRIALEQLEDFKQHNLNICEVLNRLSLRYLEFIRNISQLVPANNSVLSNSKYIEVVIDLLTNMFENLYLDITALDKEFNKQ